MSLENEPAADNSESDGLANVLQLPFRGLKGFVVLPPPELRTEPQGPWVSVDFHRDDPDAEWVYSRGAARRSFAEVVELEMPEVSGL